MGLQILPINHGGSVSKKKTKSRGISKKGSREVKNLVCSINYDGRSASGEAGVSIWLSMKVVSWNVRGLDGREKRRLVRELLLWET